MSEAARYRPPTPVADRVMITTGGAISGCCWSNTAGGRPDAGQTGTSTGTRPGKSSGTSATLREKYPVRLFLLGRPHSNPNRGYSPFAVYALLEHNGDFEAATRDLSGQGYGNDTPSTDVDLSGLLPKIVENEKDSEPKGESSDSAPFSSRLLEVPGFIGEMSRFITETNYNPSTGPFPGRGDCPPRPCWQVEKYATLRILERIFIYWGSRKRVAGRNEPGPFVKSSFRHTVIRQGPSSSSGPASLPGGSEEGIATNPSASSCGRDRSIATGVSKLPIVAPHLQGILRTITEMFTSAGSVYCSDTHSDDRDDFTIVQPNLVVYGTSTPDELFAGPDNRFHPKRFLRKNDLVRRGQRSQRSRAGIAPASQKLGRSKQQVIGSTLLRRETTSTVSTRSRSSCREPRRPRKSLPPCLS